MASQSPIIGWAGAAVRLFYVYLGYARIVLHHVQRTVTEQRLKCEYISARAQVRDRECVPEPMGIAFLHLRFLAQRCYHQSQCALAQGMSGLAQKQWRTLIFAVFSVGQIASQCVSGRFAPRHGSAFAAFRAAADAMFDLYSARLLIHITDLERAQLRGAQSCVQQSQDDRSVSFRCRAAHGESPALNGLGFPAELAYFQSLNVFFREWLDGRFFKARGGNGLHRVRHVKLGARPSEKSRQGYPDIANGFGREWLIAASQTMGLVLGAQPSQMVAQILRGHIVDINIADVCHT